MIRHPVRALACLAGVLALVLAAEWLLPENRAPALSQSAALPVAAADSGDDANVAKWAGIVLARPLLRQSRRQAPPPAAAVSDTLPRLSAIVVIGGSRRAIFSQDGQKPQLAMEGDTVGAYQVKKVGPDMVDLLGPNGPLSVKPQFVPAASGATTAPSP